jgi:hypothetical protein
MKSNTKCIKEGNTKPRIIELLKTQENICDLENIWKNFLHKTSYLKMMNWTLIKLGTSYF